MIFLFCKPFPLPQTFQRDNTLTYILDARTIVIFILSSPMNSKDFFKTLDEKCDDLVPRLGSRLEQQTCGMKVSDQRKVVREKIADLRMQSDMPGSEGDNLGFAANEAEEILPKLS